MRCHGTCVGGGKCSEDAQLEVGRRMELCIDEVYLATLGGVKVMSLDRTIGKFEVRGVVCRSAG